MFVTRWIFFQIGAGQLEQRGGRAEPVLLQVHERARQLNQPFVERAIRPVAIRQPQFFQHVMRFVKMRLIEAHKIAKIMRVHTLAPAAIDQRCNRRALFAHG